MLKCSGYAESMLWGERSANVVLIWGLDEGQETQEMGPGWQGGPFRALRPCKRLCGLPGAVGAMGGLRMKDGVVH